MDDALHALNRFGLGARLGEARSIGDPRGWLRAQLQGDPPALRAPEVASPASIAGALEMFRQARQGDRQARQLARRRLVEIASAEARAAIEERISTGRPFLERLVMFWSNHLCVSTAAKVLVAPLAGSYERDSIRPHVLGRFENLVLASARHPAMLIYLDNFQSIGPASPAAQAVSRRGRQRGLNENYARELLELHTLGVDGGYTQQDVQEVARILTGWSVSGLPGVGNARMVRGGGRRHRSTIAQARDMLGFEYRELLHEPGARTVLGVKYPERGIEQGERAIRDFCRHPSTARFLATKLVTHFVADTPPPAAVDRIAGVFRQTDGDLRQVSLALVDLSDAWSGETRKFRTPQEWFIAALRAFNATSVNDGAPGALRQLRHPLWSPQAPKGFGDSAQEWADPDSLLNRAELARTLVRRLRPREDPRALLEVVDVAERDPLRTLLSDTSIPAADRIALGLAGPAFQWR